MPTTNKKSIRWLKRALTVTLLGAGVGYGGWYYWEQLRDYLFERPPRFETAAVSRGQLTQVVTASGQLNPVVKVEVGSQISGNIQQLLADFNSPVKEGQLIAKLDSATYEANFIQAEGNLANANAALELARISAQRAQALQSN